MGISSRRYQKKENDQRQVAASITQHNSCAHIFGKLLLLAVL
jgi:hypothetical protein